MNRVYSLHEVHNAGWFDKLIRYLTSRYEMTSMDNIREYFSGVRQLTNTCHITVDDGDSSFYHTIFPVLKKYGVPATLYVSPKIITERTNYWFQEIAGYDKAVLQRCISGLSVYPLNKIKMFHPVWILKTLPVNTILAVIKEYQNITGTPPRPSMNITPEQLMEIDRSGLVTLGAHTMNHPILHNEDHASCEYEIGGSITMLSGILNKKVRYFAYPNGRYKMDFTEREEDILLKNGIDLAVTTMGGNLSDFHKQTRIPRLGIPDGLPLYILKTKTSLGAYWERIRRVISPEEIRQRTALSKIKEQFQNVSGVINKIKTSVILLLLM